MRHAGEPGAVYAPNADVLLRQRLPDVLEHRLQLLAVSAPRGVELDQPHALLAQGQEAVAQLQDLGVGGGAAAQQDGAQQQRQQQGPKGA